MDRSVIIVSASCHAVIDLIGMMLVG